jgi:hypothetical protein
MGSLLQFQGRGSPTHGFGFHLDPAGHQYNKFFLHPASRVSAASLPRRTNNARVAFPIHDQGRTGSCFGHGMAGQVTTTLAARGKPLPSPASPDHIYRITREVDRPDPTVPLQDSGSAPNSGVRALALWGLALESEVDGGRTSSSPDYTSYLEAHVCDSSKLGELEVAGKRLLSGFNAIADNDPQKLLQYQQSLASGHAVGTGVDAGNNAFQGADGRLPLGFCGAEPDHWIFILDYAYVGALRADGDLPSTMAGLPDTDLLFLLQNSWGFLWPSYTRAGRIWVTSDFVARGAFNSLATNLGV